MPEEKKSWFKKHWILTGILLIFVIIIIIAIANSGKKSNSNANTNSNNNVAVNNYACPDLSSMKLQDYDSLLQSWTAQVSPYKSGGVEVVYTYNSEIEKGTHVIYCDVGSTEGQNANWVYCGDTLRPIVTQYTDNSGAITKKRSVEVTFDKNTKQYLATKCDTYDLLL